MFLWPVLGFLQFFVVLSGDREREVAGSIDDPGDVGGSRCHRLSCTVKQTEARVAGSMWPGQEKGPKA